MVRGTVMVRDGVGVGVRVSAQLAGHDDVMPVAEVLGLVG